MAKTYNARQRRVKIRIEGADQIVRRLKAMETAAADVLMKAAKEGGEIALKDAKRNCPVDTGALKESLQLVEKKKTATRAETEVNYDKSLRYGTFVELGMHGKPGNPFLRNAVDENEKQINGEIVKTISSVIGKEM